MLEARQMPILTCRNEYFIRTHIYARTGILLMLWTLPAIIM